MKFSKRKKAKIRKNNQRRVKRVHGDMIGCCVDYIKKYRVKDQAIIKNTMYLLVKEESSYEIYKIPKVHEYVKLSPKRILQNQKDFSKHMNWRNHSVIQINEEGKIETVKHVERQVIWKNNKPVYTYVIQ